MKRSVRARLPSKTETWRCENMADHDPNIAETILKPSRGRPSSSIFRGTFCAARHIISRIHYLSKTHFVREIPQKWQPQRWKAKLSRGNSLRNWNLKMWKRSCRARLPSKTGSWRCENKVFVRLLCCGTSFLWDFFVTSLLWDFFATSLLWDFNDFQRSATRKSKIRNAEVRLSNFLDSTYIISRNLKISRSLFRPERMPIFTPSSPVFVECLVPLVWTDFRVAAVTALLPLVRVVRPPPRWAWVTSYNWWFIDHLGISIISIININKINIQIIYMNIQ